MGYEILILQIFRNPPSYPFCIRMDEYSYCLYAARFEAEFLTKKMMEFQNFFSDIMEKSHPNDFIRVKPWGNLGDRKNDGYLKSKKILYQVYAPNEIAADKTIEKIDEDFNGALPYWATYLDSWQFVHNAHDGLGPTVLEKILQLQEAHHDKEIGHMGKSEIKTIVLSLDKKHLCDLLGPIPTIQTFNNLGFGPIQQVIDHIAKAEVSTNVDLRPVPIDKMERNKLSESTKQILLLGGTKSMVVDSFFSKWHDPTLGEGIANAFRCKYEEIKRCVVNPDMIFYELVNYAGGINRRPPEIEVAVYAILAYLFERCEIFEREVSV